MFFSAILSSFAAVLKGFFFLRIYYCLTIKFGEWKEPAEIFVYLTNLDEMFPQFGYVIECKFLIIS